MTIAPAIERACAHIAFCRLEFKNLSAFRASALDASKVDDTAIACHVFAKALVAIFLAFAPEIVPSLNRATVAH
jgi:hypothetical protein